MNWIILVIKGKKRMWVVVSESIKAKKINILKRIGIFDNKCESHV